MLVMTIRAVKTTVALVPADCAIVFVAVDIAVVGTVVAIVVEIPLY